MRMPGFNAEASAAKAHVEFMTTDAARPERQTTRAVISPAFQFGSSCGILCRRCVAAGGECIHLGNGRCICA